ncbi:hypothetical protein AcW1_010208 [Taiwanofungus camphoratus]|nr:hypothetical protein AcW1_010208 [Antrodia cinnamomea]KAI0954381.1 hypothetical protein AcV7_007633 [Antrodia cinnamomea]
MNVTTTILHPAIPPTSNTLEAHQRSRLIRSARKLGTVLGSTPQLVEPESSVTPIPITLLPIGSSTSRPRVPNSLASQKQGSSFSPSPSAPKSLYTSSTNSSVASLALSPPRTSSDTLPEPKSYSAKPRRSKELPRPLVLRLNAVPMPPSDRRMRALPPTPSTATSMSIPVTPTTPVAPTATETRRKRMAKLKHTLGENIPFDLVFPSPARSRAPSSSPAKAGRRRSMSVNHEQDMLSMKRTSRVWVTGNNVWTGEWNRKDIKEVQQQLRALKVR